MTDSIKLSTGQLTIKQIEKFRTCLKRELNKRKHFYPRYVAGCRMSQETADKEIATVEEMLNYFNYLIIHTTPEQQKLF